MNFYASHMDVLKKVLSVAPKNSCLEFGPGDYSTELLSKTFLKFTSIEMNSKEWFDKVVKKCSNVFYCPGPFEWRMSLKLKAYYDFVFVDGHQDSRWDCVNWAFQHTDLIVAHDTEENLYHWEKIQMPEGWHRIDVVSARPWTSIFYTDEIISLEQKFVCETSFTIVLDGKYFNKQKKIIPGSIAWVTKLGTTAFVTHKKEFEEHLSLGDKSIFLCNFPLSPEHAKAELAGIETIINMDNKQL